MHNKIETDCFRSILTTFVVSAQLWAIDLEINGNTHVEIETDSFRSILTTSVASTQLRAIDRAVNVNAQVNRNRSF